MDRVWLLTWTTYGTWLPGDPRGFVSNFAGADGKGRRQNAPGSLPEADHPGLVAGARATLAEPAVWLTLAQAREVLKQFRETAGHRGWTLVAAAVMANHVHLVVGADGDPEPDLFLRDFKSYGSRRLSRAFGAAAGTTWWTQGGSNRILPDGAAVEAAVAYVERQANPLAVWSMNCPGEFPT